MSREQRYITPVVRPDWILRNFDVEYPRGPTLHLPLVQEVDPARRQAQETKLAYYREKLAKQERLGKTLISPAPSFPWFDRRLACQKLQYVAGLMLSDEKQMRVILKRHDLPRLAASAKSIDPLTCDLTSYQHVQEYHLSHRMISTILESLKGKPLADLVLLWCTTLQSCERSASQTLLFLFLPGMQHDSHLRAKASKPLRYWKGICGKLGQVSSEVNPARYPPTTQNTTIDRPSFALYMETTIRSLLWTNFEPKTSEWEAYGPKLLSEIRQFKRIREQWIMDVLTPLSVSMQAFGLLFTLAKTSKTRPIAEDIQHYYEGIVTSNLRFVPGLQIFLKETVRGISEDGGRAELARLDQYFEMAHKGKEAHPFQFVQTARPSRAEREAAHQGLP